MDSIAIADIGRFASELVEYAEQNAKTFMKQIREKKMWEDDGEAELKQAIEDFKKVFAQ